MNLLGEKVFRLTHFRCRKRCYRLCGLALPRNAAIFWLGWGFLQAAFWTDLRLSVFPGLPRSWFLPFWIFTVTAWWTLWIFGVLMLGFSYYGLVHRCRRMYPGIGSVLWALAAEFTAVFPLYSAVILAPCLWWKKRRIWALAATVCTLAAVSGWSVWGLGPWWCWISQNVALIGIVAALAAFPDGTPRRWRAWIPMGLLVVEIVVAWSVYGVLLGQVREAEQALVRAGGQVPNPAVFWREQRQGLQVDEDPVWSVFIDRKPKRGVTPGETDLAEFERENPEWLAALDRIAASPVQPIGHKLSKAVLPWEIMLPELNALRFGAQYFRGRIMAHPGDRDAVLRDQAALARLRDWALQDWSLISQLVAVAIESMRIQSLEYPLAAGSLSHDEWLALTAPGVDWRIAIREALNAEALNLQRAIWYATIPALPKRNWMNELRGNGGEAVGVKIMRMRDYLAGISCLTRQMEALMNPELTCAEQMEAFESAYPRDRSYILTHMVLGPDTIMPRTVASMEDWRRMARAAYRIDAMYRASGVLPEAPEFLAEPEYRSTLTGEPFRYEAGDLTGKRETPFHGFRLSIAPPPNANEEMTRAVKQCVFPVAYPDHALVKQ